MTEFTPPALPVRAPRSDGVEARARLLHAALRLFATKGFANTSTRELATAAGVNIASISYYFGDKAGLYRAAYTEPMGGSCGEVITFDPTQAPLEPALRLMLTQFVAPLKQGDLVQQCMRLHFREMLEPTGLWAEEIDNGIRPAHEALLQVLCQHLKLEQADDDIHRLAFSIVGLAIHMFVGRDIMQVLRPQLQDDAAAIDTYTERLLSYALAMVASEQSRRLALASHP
ncbi:MAG: CerR family C-terminal domain-containing protein [Burkholderiaceae bacterium]|nr:CerR family C-terminal domain-containing protein [Burkholderiaceae bacterium]